MIRLLAAALLLAAVSAPAFACPWNQTVSTDTQPSTVASQPADQSTTPPPSAPPADHQS